MTLVLNYHTLCDEALSKGADINSLVKLPIRERIGRFKYVPVKDIKEEYKILNEKLREDIAQAVAQAQEQ